ncbi:oligosaccharide flippase family protein [Comamonas testosteroni]|uniref:oligosaccharide flippase family protein n=1 Tax=Comamonas testosteroni TaxID=285 RepID=UPI00076D0AF1|nr:oligosaccharide flippase family protein [Comamonas testosteroni]KWT74586.1 Membrane protein [Comamonas testosteroni]
MSGIVLQSIKWLVIERGGQILIALLLNSILARHLGVENFGALQAALSTVAVFSSAALVCGAELILPIYGEDQKKYKNIFAEAFLARLLFQAMAFVFCIIFIFKTQGDNIFLYVTLAFIVILVEPANVFAIYFQFWSQQKWLSLLKIVAVFLKMAIVFLLIFFNFSLEKFGIAYLCEAALIAFGLMLMYRMKGLQLAAIPQNFLIKQIFSNGLLFGLGIFFMIFFQNMDRLALDYFNMKVELGLYSAAAQIAGNWYGVVNLIIQSVSGRLVYSKPEVEANNMILRMAVLGLLIAILATFFAYVLGPIFIKSFFGSSYEKSADYLIWMVGISSLVFSDAIFSMKMIKSRKSFNFTVKWFLAAVFALLYTFACKYYSFKYNPIVGLMIGYFVAAMFALINFFIGVRREENTNNM